MYPVRPMEKVGRGLEVGFKSCQSTMIIKTHSNEESTIPEVPGVGSPGDKKPLSTERRGTVGLVTFLGLGMCFLGLGSAAAGSTLVELVL